MKVTIVGAGNMGRGRNLIAPPSSSQERELAR